MAVSTEIMRSWRQPGPTVRRLLPSMTEGRALAFVMGGCLLIFVAQWPRLVRLSEGIDLPTGGEVQELSQLIAYSLVSWLIVWPLIFYIAAGITRIVARLFKGKGSGYGARLAMFNRLFRTVRKGDVIRIDYLPDSGTEVRINGEWRGAVEGNDFFRAILSIWLGDKPVTESLRKGMLGMR